MIKIEKNVPVSAKIRKLGAYKYPFRQMKLGDSFLFLKGTKNQAVVNAVLRANLLIAPKNQRFIQRMTPKGARCWLVKR